MRRERFRESVMRAQGPPSSTKFRSSAGCESLLFEAAWHAQSELSMRLLSFGARGAPQDSWARCTYFSRWHASHHLPLSQTLLYLNNAKSVPTLQW